MIEPGHYHLAGVAGVGMSALAQVLVSLGCTVTGSDRYADRGEDMEVIGKLRRSGVVFHPQDGSGVGPSAEGLVVSSAIEDDNPDVLAATRLGVPIIHRAELLAGVVEDRQCVAVTGTSGKSTVTGMIGWLLEQIGADPTVVNGAPVVNWSRGDTVGNVRCGRSNLWVIEADESDRSLLHFSPDWAVITNVSEDHFGVKETAALFRTFARQVKRGVVGLTEEPNLFEGLAPTVSAADVRFEYKDVEFLVPLPGRHNAENAMCAVRLCERLGCELTEIQSALARFRGVCRRLERVGRAAGVAVIDDYAHNPAKIRAAWQAVAPYHTRVLAVWRPHGYGPLSAMMDALVCAFAELCREGDRLYVLPVYDVGGTADRSTGSQRLADLLGRRRAPVALVRDYDAAVAAISEEARSGDVVLTMGARDPRLPALARRILSSLS